MGVISVLRDAFKASRGAKTRPAVRNADSSLQMGAARLGQGTGDAVNAVEEFLGAPVDALRGLPGMGFLPEAGTAAASVVGLLVLYGAWKWVLPMVM